MYVVQKYMSSWIKKICLGLRNYSLKIEAEKVKKAYYIFFSISQGTNGIPGDKVRSHPIMTSRIILNPHTSQTQKPFTPPFESVTSLMDDP